MISQPKKLRKPNQSIDLHSHSYYSDGKLSPTELAVSASGLGVGALALTDHDSIEGLPEFMAAAKDFDPIPGVEVTALHEGREIHILGLLFLIDSSALAERLKAAREERRARLERMVKKLQVAGLALEVEDVTPDHPGGSLGRPHLAQAMIRKGLVAGFEEAFQAWLRPGRPGYEPQAAPSVPQAIEWIHDAGGAAVIAHPAKLHRNRWIREFCEMGLDGIEVWHPSQFKKDERRLLRICEEMGVIPTGGSDFHGEGRSASVLGSAQVPEETLNRLQDVTLARQGG